MVHFLKVISSLNGNKRTYHTFSSSIILYNYVIFEWLYFLCFLYFLTNPILLYNSLIWFPFSFLFFFFCAFVFLWHCNFVFSFALESVACNRFLVLFGFGLCHLRNSTAKKKISFVFSVLKSALLSVIVRNDNEIQMKCCCCCCCCR